MTPPRPRAGGWRGRAWAALVWLAALLVLAAGAVGAGPAWARSQEPGSGAAGAGGGLVAGGAPPAAGGGCASGGEGAAVSAAPAAPPGPGSGVLVVQARTRSFGGAMPPRDQPAPPPIQQPLAGLTVQVDAADAPGCPVAAGVTDAEGRATFTLPAGQYVVYAPRDVPSPGFTGGALVGQLPDGRAVYAQAEATVVAGGEVAATLVLTVLNP